uniref:Uncharacterized protein n=1 Tax=Aegilops tauschii subsp. strangulata TaxID=200361 RepID=A0A453FY97_AEGTS
MFSEAMSGWTRRLIVKPCGTSHLLCSLHLWLVVQVVVVCIYSDLKANWVTVRFSIVMGGGSISPHMVLVSRFFLGAKWGGGLF